ncbi:metallophosphoesterase [bacterium]|nr:metallophosphoesterase [bacterium]
MNESSRPISSSWRQGWRAAAYRIASRVKVHVAGKPHLRRHAGRALKGLGAGVAYATLVEPRWIETTHIEIDVRGLPEELDGYRIVQLTDVHFNMVSGRRFLERIVEKSNALDADLCVLTGDFVTHDASKLSECLGILSELRAADGLIATRGNHDYETPLERMRGLCEENGIQLLENEHAAILANRHRNSNGNGFPHHHARVQTPLVVGGVGDMWEGIADVSAAFEGAPRGPRILLSHNPQVAEVVPAGMEVVLQLSGHTHGGQIRPFNRPLRILSDGTEKYISGLVKGPHVPVYISRGVGTSALYFRWNCRPEIVLATLHVPR